MKIAERVENILKASRESRNSDKELLIIYMQKSGMNLSEQQKQIFRDLPSMETLRRIRQKLQEQGKYEADPEVDKARFRKYKIVRGNIGMVNAKTAEDLLEERGYRII